MTEPILTQTRIANGWWEGVLTGATAAPLVEALHQGRPLPGVAVAGQPEARTIRVPIDASIL